MTLPTKRIYLEGISPTYDWTRERWEELARLVRGRHRGVGHPGDMALWVEYPVIEGGEPALAKIHPGNLVIIDPETNAVRLYSIRDFTEET